MSDQAVAGKSSQARSFSGRLMPEITEDTNRFRASAYAYVVVSVLSLLIIGEMLIRRTVGAHEELGQLLQFAAAVFAAVPMFTRTLGSIFDEDAEAFADLLVSAAVFGALLTGEYLAAAIVPLIMDLGHYLEQKSIQGTRAAIDGLRKLSAKTANLLSGDAEREVAVEELCVGDTVLVRPGDLVPVDGTIEFGSSSIDEATITGEALPRDVCVPDQVFAGTVNLTGRIHVSVQKTGENTSLGAIAGLLQTAAASKAPIVRTMERYAALYIPGIVLLAAVVFFVTQDLQRVITVFVVSCPCALVLAGPAAMIASIARATKMGVLVKNTRFLESLVDVDTVVFDKTGTVTEAQLTVCEIIPSAGYSREEVLDSAGRCASGSSHPVSLAICRMLPEPPLPCELLEVPGCGVEADVGSERLRLGKPDWIHEAIGNKTYVLPEHSGLVVAVGAGDSCLGYLLLQDTVRSQAKSSMQHLRQLGIDRLVLLTGDRKISSEPVASHLNIDQLISDVLPEEKLAAVEAEREAGRRVLAVGDGINDALALAASDVGVVMGERGTEVAIQSADIVLMSNDLRRIPEIIQLARWTRNTIFTNIMIAACAGTLMLVLGSAGVLTPITGAIVHNLGSGLVLANSSRLLWMNVSTGGSSESFDSGDLRRSEAKPGNIEIAKEFVA